MKPAQVEEFLRRYGIDHNKTITALVQETDAERLHRIGEKKDTFFKLCQHDEKEFIVYREGADEARLFKAASIEDMQNYLGRPPDMPKPVKAN